MKDTVYITGHKNPDTDSICSALAYANLKNRLGETDAIPIRLGHINQETQFVLDYFGMKAPIFKDSMKLQIKDINYDNSYNVDESLPIRHAWSIIQENKLNSLFVVDEREKLIGVASLSNLTHSYMEVWDDKIIGRTHTSLENIADVLSAKVIVNPENPREFTGKMMVFAMNEKDSPQNDLIGDGDLVITGNRREAQEYLLERNVSLIILTNGSDISEDLKEMAKNNHITIISTEYDTFMTARLLPMSIPIANVMSTENIVYFTPDDTVDTVRELMGKTRFRSYPILDTRGRVLGAISRYHLITDDKKKLILVDHNERNQSIDDIDYAEIVEIIDHHRVANVVTNSPLFFRAEPVGSTATIVAKMFFESGIRPSKEIAGILSAAIISDTLLFRSPTTTETDKRILKRLTKIADLDEEDFAMKMFKAGTSLKNKSPEDLIEGDVKTFTIGEDKIRVGQVMTMNPEELEPIKEELEELMKEKIRSKGENTFVLVLTDIFNKKSELLVVGNYLSDIENVFGNKVKNGTISAPGVLSRKKQVIPKITEAIVNSHNN
ncbi:putative manganese-dependent inorganic diphosphatase [Anaerococcus porci]|uniref:inorganic diphosphatase n=1 Tax=Anaerococcus porci TaxID=2652269 RepID=A0A6N7VSE8_9FIRM|nr:putative manganese-dependent inorganic diphosphatase [Anaerococcus porci]MDY3006887.1 putative manganese-dependent inorganic diphosphatase [Anaerococcus porci]MSS77786.1 putative manganese-dependent inorganic diphosphatase [Anaerococcus porci]